MATTYELITATTLSSAVNTVTIGSGGTIPQTYTDLELRISVRNTDTQAALYIRPNGSTSSLSAVRLMADGNTISSGTSGSTIYCFILNASTTTSSTFSNASIYIPNYTSSNNKSISIDGVSETNGNTDVFRFLGAGLWSNSSAITSIDLVAEGTGTFAVNSTFYLYGIKNS